MQMLALVAIVFLTIIIFATGLSLQGPVVDVQGDVAAPAVRVSDTVVADTPQSSGSGWSWIPNLLPAGGVSPATSPVTVSTPAVTAPAPVATIQAPTPVTIQRPAAPAPVSAVSIQTTQNIEATTATLRGQAVVGEPSLGTVFFAYSYDQDEVTDVVRRSSYQAAVDRYDRGLLTYRAATSLSSDRTLSTSLRNLAPDTTYYARLCAQVGARLLCSDVTSFTTTPRVFRDSDALVPTISSLTLDHLSSQSVRLGVQVNMRDMSDGEVYLVYGESQSQVSAAWGQEYSDIDEDDEDLQKTRVARDLVGQREFVEVISDLDEETRQYYLWCVQYDGPDDGVVCSRVNYLTTHTDTYAQTPDMTLTGAIGGGTVAQLQGTVDMDDFRNGRVFFVYGTNANNVANVPGVRSFTNVRQSGDSLQKRLVDDDLDRSDSYTLTVSDLLPNTTYTAALCVQYQNQDQYYRDVAHVACSGSREFTTS